VSGESEALVSRAGEGDEEAIGALLERHLPRLRAYIRLRMGPRVRRWESEADVAQSVCLEALKNLDGFTARGEAAFRQWLFTMARRKLSQRDDYLEAARRDVDLVISNAGSNASGDPMAFEMQRAFGSPSEIAVRGETLARIERALDGMTEEMREVILMSRLVGLPTTDIAQRLGKQPGAVRVTLCRGLAALGRAIG